jgi:hypothetical protein
MSRDLIVISGKTLTTTEIAEAIKTSGIDLLSASEILGIERYELDDIIKNNQFLYKLLTQEYEKASDLAARNVVTGIKGGNVNLSMWWLENIAKERGFSKRVELTLQKVEKSIEDMSEAELNAKMADIHNELLEQGFKIDPDTGKMLPPPPRALQAWEKPGWKPGE